MNAMNAMNNRPFWFTLHAVLLALLVFGFALRLPEANAPQVAAPAAAQPDAVEQYRAARDTLRATLLNALNSLARDGALGDDAQSRLAELTLWIAQESAVEGALSIKGFSRPLASRSALSITVYVGEARLSDARLASIVDVATLETGLAPDAVRVVPNSRENSR